MPAICLLLSDGAVPVSSAALEEAVSHHTMAKHKKDDCQEDYKQELSNSKRGWLSSCRACRIQISCHQSAPSAKSGARHAIVIYLILGGLVNLILALAASIYGRKLKIRLAVLIRLGIACIYAGSPSEAVRVNRKVEPWWSSLSARIVPSWARTICLAMASPSPVPPDSRERALSTR